MQPIVIPPWHWALAAHILCAVAWVGGMAFAMLIVRPSLGNLEPAQRVAVHHQVFRRFFRMLWHIIPILLISAYAMILTAYHGDFAHLPWNVNVMQGLGWIMVLVFLWVFFVPYRRFRAAASNARAAVAGERIRKLIMANLVLGVIVIIVAAL